MASTLRGTGALSWVRPPGRPVASSPSLQQQQVHFHNRICNRSTLRIRRSSQENTVQNTQSEEAPNSSEQAEEKPSSEAQAQEEQKQTGDALKELRDKDSSSGFWAGLVQEIGLIEWPDIGRVFGTTLVVLGIIFGSSIVLLTVNFLLAQLSDIVFKVQSSQ